MNGAIVGCRARSVARELERARVRLRRQPKIVRRFASSALAG